MSDKLKIMQTRIDDNHNSKSIEPYSASIGYPDLKSLPNKEGHANCHGQPELDESAFRDYVSKTEYLLHTSSQIA